MLDSREKQLTHRIQDALQRYEKLPTAEERYVPTRELAELYWELVYQNLVQGDMRQFSLEQVQRYANEALKYKAKDAGLWAISGRVKCNDNKYYKMVSACLLYTSPSPRDRTRSRMPSSA